MDDRSTGIGSSDVAAIVGVSPWGTPYSVYAEKVGLTEKLETERMAWGKKLQRVVAEEWSARKKVGITWLDETRRHKTIQEFMATPDFAVWCDNTPATEGGEVKTADWKQRDFWGEPGTDQIPPWYLVQCQWQCFVLGWKRVYVPVLFGGNQLESYVVEGDPELQTELAKRAEEFWKSHVEPRVPPELDWSDAARQSLRRRFPKAVSAEYRESNDREEALMLELAKLKRQKVAVTRAYDTVLNRVKEAIGESKGIRGPGFVVSYFNVQGSRYMVERKPGRSFKARGEIFDVGTEEEAESGKS
jgi:putative phage-type endonuclease